MNAVKWRLCAFVSSCWLVFAVASEALGLFFTCDWSRAYWQAARRLLLQVDSRQRRKIFEDTYRLLKLLRSCVLSEYCYPTGRRLNLSPKNCQSSATVWQISCHFESSWMNEIEQRSTLFFSIEPYIFLTHQPICHSITHSKLWTYLCMPKNY